MNPWFFPWLGLFKAPLSGDVAQDYAPITSWLSPQFEFNFAGNRKIEAEVVSDVASYGKQLGILAEAVLELADGSQGEAVVRLRQMKDQIDLVIQQHEDRLEEKVKADLDQLQKQDPQALKRLLDEYGK
jgi:hypothetical protein